MRHEQPAAKIWLPPAAVAVFRQHFEDFYGESSDEALERFVRAERVELSQIARHDYIRALLHEWKTNPNISAQPTEPALSLP